MAAKFKKGEFARKDAHKGTAQESGYVVEGKVGVYKWVSRREVPTADPDKTKTLKGEGWGVIHLPSGLSMGNLAKLNDAKGMASDIIETMPDSFWVERPPTEMIVALSKLTRHHKASHVKM